MLLLSSIVYVEAGTIAATVEIFKPGPLLRTAIYWCLGANVFKYTSFRKKKALKNSLCILIFILKSSFCRISPNIHATHILYICTHFRKACKHVHKLKG